MYTYEKQKGVGGVASATKPFGFIRSVNSEADRRRLADRNCGPFIKPQWLAQCPSLQIQANKGAGKLFHISSVC